MCINLLIKPIHLKTSPLRKNFLLLQSGYMNYKLRSPKFQDAELCKMKITDKWVIPLDHDIYLPPKKGKSPIRKRKKKGWSHIPACHTFVALPYMQSPIFGFFVCLFCQEMKYKVAKKKKVDQKQNNKRIPVFRIAHFCFFFFKKIISRRVFAKYMGKKLFWGTILQVL